MAIEHRFVHLSCGRHAEESTCPVCRLSGHAHRIPSRNPGGRSAYHREYRLRVQAFRQGLVTSGHYSYTCICGNSSIDYIRVRIRQSNHIVFDTCSTSDRSHSCLGEPTNQMLARLPDITPSPDDVSLVAAKSTPEVWHGLWLCSPGRFLKGARLHYAAPYDELPASQAGLADLVQMATVWSYDMVVSSPPLVRRGNTTCIAGGTLGCGSSRHTPSSEVIPGRFLSGAALLYSATYLHTGQRQRQLYAGRVAERNGGKTWRKNQAKSIYRSTADL